MVYWYYDFYPLSNHLRESAIKSHFSGTTIDNISLKFVSNLSVEWWFV